MGWRFRKTFSPLPGVRLTLSPSGISTSVGVGPLRLTAGPRGTTLNANLPGTGISFRQNISGSLRQSGSSQPEQPLVPRSVTSQPTTHNQFSDIKPAVSDLELQPTTNNQLSDIKSAGSEILTTSGLDEFKRLLERSRHQHQETSRELLAARTQEQIENDKYNRWKNGWFLRHILKAKFHQLALAAEEATARREELQEQESLSRLNTQIELPQGVSQTFHRMRDEFSLLAKSARIWDTVGHRSTNKVVERTTATRSIERQSVSFRLGKCELIESEWNIPHMVNANGGDIFLYPGFVLYFVSVGAFALLEYKDVKLNFSGTQFFEEESVPRDSKVVGQTWFKTNKDGTQDKRFKNNYQIPIVRYGKIVLSSTTGLNEEYMISNAEQTEAFANAWKQFVLALRAGV